MKKNIGIVIGIILVAGAIGTATAILISEKEQVAQIEDEVNTKNIVTNEPDIAPVNAPSASTNTPAVTPIPSRANDPSSINLTNPKGGSYLLGSKVKTSWELGSATDGIVTIILLNTDNSVFGIIASVNASNLEYVWYADTVSKDGRKIPVLGDRHYKIKISLSNGNEDVSESFELAYGGPPIENN